MRADRSIPRRGWWLFSPRVDLTVFLGAALLSMALLLIGWQAGVLHSDSPDWIWIPAVLLIDIAHVWSTIFRVYLDADEMRRRPWLYAATPVIGWLVGVAIYSESPLLFWRLLAYLAVFHFVRQQYGWVNLYRARMGERDTLGRRFDTAVIYMATIFPLLYWHARIPREFWWFMPGDFVSLPGLLAQIAEPIYWALMAAYVVRSARGWLRGAPTNPGKDMIVVTTAVCWYVGIVLFDSDYAFTVTNVVIHGVPYMALVYWYGKSRLDTGRGGRAMRVFRYGPWLFLAIVCGLGFLEELVWDRAVWQERGWFFGSAVDVGAWLTWLVPLLTVPQLTHYVLDGFVWKRRHNPDFDLIPRSSS